MSNLNFTVSYLTPDGVKHDKEVYLNSEDYKKNYQENYFTLMQNYPPEQAETHVLPTKKHYIETVLENQFGKNTPLEYDVAEMINALDREVKGVQIDTSLR